MMRSRTGVRGFPCRGATHKRVLTGGVIVFAALFTTGVGQAKSVDLNTDVPPMPQGPDELGVLLGTSQDVKPAVDASVRSRVRRILAGSIAQSEPVYLTADQLRTSLGTPPSQPDDSQGSSVEIVAPRQLREDPREAVPIGLAGILWVASHPSEAWRIVAPVAAAPPPVSMAAGSLGSVRECYVPCR